LFSTDVNGAFGESYFIPGEGTKGREFLNGKKTTTTQNGGFAPLRRKLLEGEVGRGGERNGFDETGESSSTFLENTNRAQANRRREKDEGSSLEEIV